MNKIMTTAALLFSLFTHCQAQKNARDKNTFTEDGKTFVKVENEAQFDGGDKAWIRYLQENLRADAPVKKGAPAGKYTVVIKFIVNTNGKVDSVAAETNHGFGMENEVIRIIKNAPRWIPATINGLPVRAYRRQPVTFQIVKE